MQSMYMFLVLTFLVSACYSALVVPSSRNPPPRKPVKRLNRKNNQNRKNKRTGNKECCALNKGFDFAGTACVISGDPHFSMFNGGKHDVQGQPMTMTTSGNYKDAFYYVSRCAGKKVSDLPFQILGTHYYGKKVLFTRTSVTLLDYITIELTDSDGSLYYLYFSSHFRAFAPAATDGVDISYDKTLADAPSAITEIELGTTTKIGEMFSFVFSANAKKKTATDMTMTVSFYDDGVVESADVFIQMRGTTGKANTDPYTPYPDRARFYQAAYITLADEWKCGACGLCGQFTVSPSKSKQTIQKCDGSWTDVVDGTGWSSAYDKNGLSYEYNYFNTQCGAKYAVDRSKKGPATCPAWKQKIVTAKCNAAMKLSKVRTCCNKIGSTECQRLRKDCLTDACQLSDDTKTSIQTQVNEGLIDEVMDLCNIKNVKTKMKNQNLLPFDDVEYSDFDQYEVDDDDEDVFDDDDDMFDDGDDVIGNAFNDEPVFQPLEETKPSEYVLTFTGQDLLIMGLVAANLILVATVGYFVCARRNASKQKYVSVKMVADTEDEEEAHFVQ